MLQREAVAVDDPKLQLLLKSCWSDYEEPLIYCSLGYRFKDRDSWKHGLLLVTRGAVYLFKSKVFSGIKFLTKFHLLRVATLQVGPSTLSLHFQDDSAVHFKLEQPARIAYKLNYLIHEMLYGVEHHIPMRIDSTVPIEPVTLSSRLQFALKWRAIFLAHYYNIPGEQLHTVTYFDRWEIASSEPLNIGATFHPGNFAVAFGHAIGWEVALTTVWFQHFVPSKFADLLNSIIEHAETIKTIIFSDYTKKKFPRFKPRSVTRSPIANYRFRRAPIEMVHNFLDSARTGPPIQSITLHKVASDPAGFTHCVDLLLEPQNAAARHLRKFIFAKMHVPDLSTTDFHRIVNNFEGLQEITVSNCIGDAEHYLRAIMSGPSSLRVINLTKMTFKSVPEPHKITFPRQLLAVRVSYSTFQPEAFGLFLKLMTEQQVAYPFRLEMSSLVLSSEAWGALGNVSFSDGFPNVSEFEFSDNSVPAQNSPALFAFLAGQTRLRLLTLQNMKAADPIAFLRAVLALVKSQNLAGLDISGEFETVTFSQFLRALGDSRLRRLIVTSSNSGVAGMEVLTSLISSLPELNEIGADGFAPEDPQAVYALWTAIAAHPSITSCDLPIADSKSARIIFQRTPHEYQEAYARLQSKLRPSATRQRLEYAMNLLDSGQGYDSTPDLYRQVSEVKWEADETILHEM
jgi:hypothetical protein